jgi:hypothetical protein
MHSSLRRFRSFASAAVYFRAFATALHGIRRALLGIRGALLGVSAPERSPSPPASGTHPLPRPTDFPAVIGAFSDPPSSGDPPS